MDKNEVIKKLAEFFKAHPRNIGGLASEQWGVEINVADLVPVNNPAKVAVVTEHLNLLPDMKLWELIPNKETKEYKEVKGMGELTYFVGEGSVWWLIGQNPKITDCPPGCICTDRFWTVDRLDIQP